MTGCDLIADFDFMTDFNGIDRQFPNPMYPSGIYDGEKMQYKYGGESVEYPNLALAEKLHDQYGNEIPEGFYTVMLSMDKRFLNLYQSNEIKARVKVYKLTSEMRAQEEINHETDIIGRIEKAKRKQKLKKQKEAEEELEAFRKTEAAKSYAELEDTGEGYYKLKYSCFGHKAEGVIQK